MYRISPGNLWTPGRIAAKGTGHEREHEREHRTPADRYQELFVAVQRQGVFADSKTFVDCAPRIAPDLIVERYRARHQQPGFDLHAFVHEHFQVQPPVAKAYAAPRGQSLAAHIDALWDVLTRHPPEDPPGCSLLALPCDYVVPGGRFAELYYWDSYFAMVGLADSGQLRLLRAMLDNFAHLIDVHGYVPNGNRTYYLSRSQPPVFALMVELCAAYGVCDPGDFLPQLRREHAFWMQGEDALLPGGAHRRLVMLPDGLLLNRYWDDRDTPREESWKEDVATAAGAGRPAAQVYRDIRAACESGWDFSSRWLDGPELASIRTTSILPVDLNALLYQLERLISRLGNEAGDATLAREFGRRAEHRHRAIDATFWQPREKAYLDYDWERRAVRPQLNAATVVPLFAGIASKAQATAVASTCRARLLAPGGLATTCVQSGQQWDRPNGWAPLQWMAVRGFLAYGQHRLAASIRSRWVRTVGDVFRREAHVVEKYALRELPDQDSGGGGGGEYPLQNGFGWTNGVTRPWLRAKPARNVHAGDATPPPDPEDAEPATPLPPV